ncbi:MAG: rhomboid family intramembrane serine protease [Fibrobacteraceae bacterium]|nr:rhomboid family intramembrane serine protease [Fibrobacteraceae bacterium]
MFGMKPFRDLSSPIRILLIINAAVFGVCFITNLLGWDLIGNYIVEFSALVPVRYGEVWRYLTYAFVHVNVWHFLFNMLALWMFGDDVAVAIGYPRFWVLYLFSAVFSGLFSIPFYLFGAMSPFTYIIGASGALMGIFVAYARLFPDRMILLFFVIPMRIKHAIWFFVILDVLLSQSNDSVAHFTHLGGILSGFLCMYLYEKGFSWAKLRGEFKINRGGSKKTEQDALEGEVGYIDRDKQLDLILKKVSESGVNSLSESEKAYLIQESERRRRGERRF